VAQPVVGVIGIGAMGLGVALHLRDLAFEVHVRDLRPAQERLAADAGAWVAPSPAALAAACDVVLTLVVDDVQTEAVLYGADGVLAGLRPGGVVVAMSTLPPAYVDDLGRRLAARGVPFIDAPCSGGPARARDGTMSLMVAGPAEDRARGQAVLDALSSRQFVVGERPGDGARTKIVNNLLAGANLVAGAEAMALGLQLGLDARILFDVIQASSGASWVFGDRIARALADDREPRARLDILRKDLSIAVAAARDAGVHAPMAEAASRGYDAASRAGYGDEDDSALLRWYREWNGSR